MAAYFDTANPEHLSYLPASLRDSDELAGLAAAAEADTLAAYTHRQRLHPKAVVVDTGTAVQRFVYLAGYTADAAQAPAALRKAVAMEVAGVIRWRNSLLTKSAGVLSESGGNSSKSYHYRDAERTLPSAFGGRLKPFKLPLLPAGL